ncbi:MAG: hypothetical protein GVY14_01625 [Spirochaetes bacterium]|jgi:tRNA-splicing ligase RtcB|nr:hypothetical protein [Spirochaetota bacterium]
MRPQDIVRVSEHLWEIPQSYRDDMQVPVRLYASGPLFAAMEEGVFEQAVNVASLPGIVGHSFCMPDGHWGYGFPIGGVAAFDTDGIFDRRAARRLGIRGPGQVVLMLHTGSRGFGHQVASDYLQTFNRVMGSKYGLKIPDKQLACAPFHSEERQAYFAAMQCAVNMAFVNRQIILHRVREVFSDVPGKSAAELGLEQIYDVTHNTAKIERHVAGGEEREVLIHRKGATRAFGPGMDGIPPEYADLGQPVIIGGSMETGSYLLLGSSTGAPAFYTTAHGSGRTMGRRQASKRFRGSEIEAQMRWHGTYVRAKSKSGLAEEAGAAYKDIDAVVESAEAAGLSRRVVRLRPVGSLKG